MMRGTYVHAVDPDVVFHHLCLHASDTFSAMITVLSLSVCPSVLVPDLRAQLTDQIKILDSQVEVKQQQLSDLSEFLRRRGDIEAEYARALDKLTERFTHKTKK